MAKRRDHGAMERWNVHLPTRILDRLDAMSRRTGVPMAEIVRRAVEEYLDRVAPAPVEMPTE